MAEDYERLLGRALEQIPKEVFEKSRFEIPEADVSTVGNRTILRNFKDILSTLRREPSHLMKYLVRELGTAGNVEGSQAVFQGRFTKSTVDDRIRRYVEEFVFCRECGKPDTRLIKYERIHMLKCEACGARASVRSV
jgi:translation initiation factor 2 subunit 2